MATQVRFLIAAAFVRRLLYRVQWRAAFRRISQRAVRDVSPERLQQLLIESCILEASRPRYQLNTGDSSGSDDEDWF